MYVESICKYILKSNIILVYNHLGILKHWQYAIEMKGK
jgi:hypothetical protein